MGVEDWCAGSLLRGHAMLSARRTRYSMTSTPITDTPSTATAGLSDRIRGAHFNLYPPSTPPGAHASGGRARNCPTTRGTLTLAARHTSLASTPKYW